MKTVIAHQYETISHIAWRYYGHSRGIVEKILHANPKLCELPAQLPAGTAIKLPVLEQNTVKEEKTIHLWD